MTSFCGIERLLVMPWRPGGSPGAVRKLRAAFQHLAVLGCTLGAAVLAEGGTVPSVWLACELAIGAQVVAWAVSQRGAAGFPRAGALFPMALLVLPLYALGQTAPLPPAFVEMLSPAG